MHLHHIWNIHIRRTAESGIHLDHSWNSSLEQPNDQLTVCSLISLAVCTGADDSLWRLTTVLSSAQEHIESDHGQLIVNCLLGGSCEHDEQQPAAICT